jgi:hypothetical protein
MKIIILSFLSLILISLTSCKKSDNPVTPEVVHKNIVMSGYGSSLDSAYYAFWSDSSWEKFSKIETVNGKTYFVIINSSGEQYYYDAIGYAGFMPAGESLILFDNPVAGLPDTMLSNTNYTRSAVFTYQGYIYTMQYVYTLLDTVNVSIPLGNFNCCIYMKTKATLTVSTQSQTQNTYWWSAKGPATIKQTNNSGTTFTLVRGIINGQGWGMPSPVISPQPVDKKLSNLFNRLHSPLFRLNKFNIPD